MKTVAVPIYFGLLHSTETTIPTDKRKKKKANLQKDLLAGGTGVSRAAHHVAAPIYQSTENHNTNANK